MIVVIIAGGSGTRLWPLSTPEHPKHLLKLIGEDTLLQSTYKRAKRLADHVYIATGGDHLQHVKEQLTELKDDNFIVEPDRRDTGGCIILALHHIQSKHGKEEPIAFLPADHFIRDEDGFVNSFRVAQEASRDANAITLIGVEPTYPATGFGYIQKDGRLDEEAITYKVQGFKEKPQFDLAKEYMQSGDYLWNAGYFVGSVGAFVEAMENYAPKMKEKYDSLLSTTDEKSRDEAFLAFDKISIDYGLMEPAQNLLVVPASFDWIDLGSFKDLHDVIDTDEDGNHSQGLTELENVENSLIRNDEADKPIAVIGLDNVIVINTKNGILITRTDQSQKVKDVVNRLLEKK